MPIMQSRRRFLAGLSAAGAGILGSGAVRAAEPTPEVTAVRLSKIPGICIAPQYVAEELLAAEGFTEVHYVELPSAIQHAALTSGQVDFSMHFAAPLLIPLDAGEPITVLAGVHPGCFEVFGNERIRSVTDLKGKRVGVQALGSSPHVFLTSIAAYVGLDPAQDIEWVSTAPARPMTLFADGQIDAFLGLPPEPQEMRSRGIGQVIVDSAIDRPWSQYFCCMLAGNRAFVDRHPVATKRVLRAILKATDLCVAEPERVARRLVADGFTTRYDHALQALTEIPYASWRDYDPEDTLRFYALRLHEAEMITSSPNRIIAEGTDWRFLDELRRELKA